MPDLYLRLRITEIIKETPDAFTYRLENTSPEPVIYQAGTSTRGRQFAAKHAEAIFLNAPSIEVM